MKDDRDWIPDATDLDWIESLSTPPRARFSRSRRPASRKGFRSSRATPGGCQVLAAGRRRIVEVGTAIGYSTLLALGQPDDGTIVTIDPDRSRTDQAREFWRHAGIADHRITVINARR